MPPAWQATGTLLGSTGADITPVIPAHAADDILILLTASRDDALTVLTPSGWTTIPSSPIGIGNLWKGYAFWKRATSSSETNPLCDWSAATGDKYGVVHNVRGAITSGNPISPSNGSNGTFSSADPATITGVTTTVANQFVCIVGIVGDNLASAATVTATDPSSFTQRTYTTIITGADAGQFFHDATRTTAGATGNLSVDFNAASGGLDAWVIAFLPPVVPNPPHRNPMPPLIAQ